MDATVDQQICLRWNNFQSNITAQFGTLRDDEDFVDVTIACGGRRFEAHKVVLSACSPFFKELFKSNPCPHPIIFMRDVEAKHVMALLEFMYAGEVQVAQAHLAGFLLTAESLQIRGLTDASKGQQNENEIHSTNEYETNQQFPHSSKKHEEISQQLFSNFKDSPQTHKSVNYEELTQNLLNVKNISEKTQSPGPTASNNNTSRANTPSLTNDDTQNSSQDYRKHSYSQSTLQCNNPSGAKRICKNKVEDVKSTTKYDNTISESPSPNSNNNQYVIHPTDLHSELDLTSIEPKTEPDYPSDDEDRTGLDESILGFDDATDIGNPFGGTSGDIEMMSGTSTADLSQDSNQALSDSRKLHSLDPRPCHLCGRVYSNLSNLRQHMRLIHHPQTVVCPYCGKQFKTTLYLKRHLVIYHNDISDQRIPPPSPSTNTQQHTNILTSPVTTGSDIKPDLQELNNAVVSSSIIAGGTNQCYQNDLIIKKFEINDVQNSTDAYGFYGGENKMYPSCQKENISFQQL